MVGLNTNERVALDDWLEFHRATLLHKCRGLGGNELARMAVPPSNLSLLGLVRHMAEVERGWFRRFVAQEDIPRLYCSDEKEDGDFELVDPARAEEDFAIFETELLACRAVAAGHDLDEQLPAPGGEPGRARNLRWIYIHMIEEYARHNGHADLLREVIDGTTGM
jgi:uncharacterized damage-inducible protein DinB